MFSELSEVFRLPCALELIGRQACLPACAHESPRCVCVAPTKALQSCAQWPERARVRYVKRQHGRRKASSYVSPSMHLILLDTGHRPETPDSSSRCDPRALDNRVPGRRAATSARKTALISTCVLQACVLACLASTPAARTDLRCGCKQAQRQIPAQGMLMQGLVTQNFLPRKAGSHLEVG